ncbi:MAG TPA: PAS domain-containing protein [Myxococcota bacterium]|nr:PAS domain-containing protein [Myxococcota bacterium]
MHPFLLIPLLTLICSCVVASGTVARDADYRPNHVVAWVMACTGLWSVLDIACSLQTDAGAALRIVRLLGFAYLPLAPLALELLARLGLIDAVVWGRTRRFLWAGVAVVAVAHATTPFFIDAVRPAPSGWRYHFGPAFWPGLLLAIGGCAATAVRLMSASDADSDRNLRPLGVILWLPMAVASLTDVALPALELDGPHLGAASIVFTAGLLWLGVFSAGSRDPASGTLARQLLDELPDGVAILRIDGTLRSANARLARILGRGLDGLIGRPASAWLGDDEGTRLREVREMSVDGPFGPRPVAVWESLILDRQDVPIGRVLVVRDQGAVMKLREQLVTAGQLSALGDLAAGIAHEVNNPLAFVLANLNELRRESEALGKLDAASPARALAETAPRIDACIASLGRVVGFVAEVRSFAHQGTGAPILFQVNELVASALRLAAPRLRDQHVVSFEPGELPELRCAPQELKHALLSLLLAVGQEGRERGHIHVRTGATDDGVFVEVETDAPLGERTAFDGAELLLAPGRGAGASLLIPGHMVRRQGGNLRAEPTATGGARVRIDLRDRPAEALA